MLLANLLLALTWTALQGEFTLGNLLTGFVLGYVVLALLSAGHVLPSRYVGKVTGFLSLAAFLLYELVLANFRMALDVVRTQQRISPGIVRVPLDVTEDRQILLLAALINLTPGSVALDVSDDRRAMYVHMMHMTTPELARAQIKDGFERRVLRLLV